MGGVGVKSFLSLFHEILGHFKPSCQKVIFDETPLNATCSYKDLWNISALGRTFGTTPVLEVEGSLPSSSCHRSKFKTNLILDKWVVNICTVIPLPIIRPR